MELSEILTLYDKEQRIEIDYPDMRKEVTPQVIRFLRPAPGMSFISYSCLDEGNADAVIQEQLSFFKKNQQPFEWKAYDHDTPPDLRDRLVAAGLEAEDPDAIMALDLQEAPPALLEPVTADVRPILYREGLRDVIRVEEQVWGENFDWITDRLGDHMEIPGYLSVYVAYVDGQPACTGWTYFHPHSQFASLWGGSTVMEFRKRGLYTAILAMRVQESIRRGIRFLTIDASPMSRSIVTSHGFRLLTYAHDCEWK